MAKLKTYFHQTKNQHPKAYFGNLEEDYKLYYMIRDYDLDYLLPIMKRVMHYLAKCKTTFKQYETVQYVDANDENKFNELKIREYYRDTYKLYMKGFLVYDLYNCEYKYDQSEKTPYIHLDYNVVRPEDYLTYLSYLYNNYLDKSCQIHFNSLEELIMKLDLLGVE